MDHHRTVATAAGAWLAIAAAPAATWWLATTTWAFASANGSFATPAWSADQALVVIIGATGAVIAAYLNITALALLATHLVPSHRRTPWVAAVTPSAWRRVIAAAAGVAMTSGIAAPAVAASDDDLSHAGWVTADAVATDLAAAEPSRAPLALEEGFAPAATSPASDHEYTVLRGDSLWKITARFLGGGTTNAAIAATWPLLYDANREVIGSNPSLIHPGQVLVIPDQVRA